MQFLRDAFKGRNFRAMPSQSSGRFAAEEKVVLESSVSMRHMRHCLYICTKAHPKVVEEKTRKE